ncbi:MAG: thiamine phosphate synthase [Archangium sp.]|nr:thiamine phosphate synthase [Archangium sp.]
MLPFRLLIITDWALGDALLERLDDALQAGPGIAVQHRNPGATGRRFFDDAVRVAAVCRTHGAPLFVNGRLDVALAVDAHLHLPAHGLRVDDVRPSLPGRLVSVAVHDEAEIQPGADCSLVSPVFPPGSKPDDTRAPLGAEGFARLVVAGAAPAVALGGLTPARARLLPPETPVAAISAVLRAPSPRAAAAAFLTA